VIPELRAVAGFVDATLAVRASDQEVEFVVLSRWSSFDAIRAFAGEDHELARVEAGAVAALTSYDRTVRHYEVVESVAGG
jgi:heme-degrading monooxygenase HmoA